MIRDNSEVLIPPHFTNIQHGLQMARKFLAVQDTPNRQVMLITDGLPTAHFEGEMLYLLYPPQRSTEEATLREGRLRARASPLTSSCCRVGASRKRMCVSLIGWRNRRAAGCSSPAAVIWIATSCGITSNAGGTSFHECVRRFAGCGWGPAKNADGFPLAVVP